jgi:hypothetical protein
VTDVRAQLRGSGLPELLARLGFADEDAAAALDVAARVAERPDDVARLESVAAGLRAGIGALSGDGEDVLIEEAGDAERFGGVGVRSLLALVVTAEDVVHFHSRRGIPADVSWRSLADLGQQVRVHRRTYGDFGLHTYGWMRIAWSGALYWLGRLQFNLQLEDDEWVLSTHIPDTGPLTPDLVDASLGEARTFFAQHFPDCPSTDFHCRSWLLDPELAAVLPADSNLVRFQRRWRLYGEPKRGDDDVLFFVFSRRGAVELDALPQATTLERAVVQRLRSGGHWNVWDGRIPQTSA